MAKSVFRPQEIKAQQDTVVLPLYKNYAPEEPEIEEVVEEYTGPTADDLRREAEAFKQQWELEKAKLTQTAQVEADEILKKAEDAAFQEVKRQTDQAAIIKAEAENQAQEIIKKAEAQAEQLLEEAQVRRQSIENESRQKGFEEGHEEGYQKGVAEVERLTERMHKMLEAVMQRREEILRDTETQIVELVILMCRKVIKILSENQKNVVMANVLAALKKVKTRGKVTLRVNLEEVKLTSEHADEFIKHIENVEGITVLEDSAVEKGGCIVETDFGAIDARISSQLTELENKIIDVSPVKNIKRSDPLAN